MLGTAGEAAKNLWREKVAIWEDEQLQDMKAHHEKLLRDAAECELISRLATDATKRDLFNRLSEHLKVLAGEVESAIQQQIRRDASR